MIIVAGLAKFFEFSHKIVLSVALFVSWNVLMFFIAGAPIVTIVILSIFWAMFALAFLAVLSTVPYDSIGRWILVVLVGALIYGFLL